MTHGAVKNFWTVQGDWHLFDPLHANIVRGADSLAQQNYYTLRVAAATRTDFELASDLSVPSGYRYDLSDYDDVIFGIKEAATDTDFLAAWQGFNAADTAWHSPANGRFSIDVAPTDAIAAGEYFAAFSLIGSAGDLVLPQIPLRFTMRVPLVIGDEPSTPDGVVANSGTATITAGNDSVTVTDTNMTATGLVVPFYRGTPSSSIGATCGSGSFVIALGGPVAVNTSVGYYIVKRS